MDTPSALAALEHDARQEFDHYHVPQLAKRFAAAYATALTVSLAAAGWHAAGWAALWSLLAGAGVAALEKLDPSVPWKAILALVQDARSVAETPAAPPHR